MTQQNQSRAPVPEQITEAATGNADELAQIARMEEVMHAETEEGILQVRREITNIEKSLRSVRITGDERASLKGQLEGLRTKENRLEERAGQIKNATIEGRGAEVETVAPIGPSHGKNRGKGAGKRSVSLAEAGVTLPSEEAKKGIVRLYGGTMNPWESGQRKTSGHAMRASRQSRNARIDQKTWQDQLPEHVAKPYTLGENDLRGRYTATPNHESQGSVLKLKKEISNMLAATPAPSPHASKPESPETGSSVLRENPEIGGLARQHVAERVHGAFGNKGIFGLGATAGVESDTWLYMKDMPVTRVLSRAVPGASEDEIARVGELVQEMSLEARITPAQGETVEQFLLRGTEEMIRSGKIK